MATGLHPEAATAARDRRSLRPVAGERRRKEPAPSRGHGRAGSADYLLLVCFIVLTFVFGGGQRADVQSLTVLRPIAALVCGYGVWSLTRARVARYAPLFWLIGAGIALCLVHLVPLPPGLWRLLPGRDIIVEVDRAAGLPDGWRPLAMVPWAARNALFSLLVPLATLLLASRLDRSEREALLPLLVGVGLVSGVLGLLQMLGPPDGPLYLYRTTSEGSAVGLFANRNHAAVYLSCLFPMIAVLASRPAPDAQRARLRRGLAVAGGLVLVPMIIASGSRAALFVALPALASMPLLYRRPPVTGERAPRRTMGTRPALLAAGVAAVALLLVVLMLARTNVLDRVLLLKGGDDLRFQVWGGIVQDVWRYLPVGSGVGSFADVYQIHEPDALLRPSYLNHAHNDLLEVAMTMGVPGLLLLVAGLVGWTRGTYAIWGARDEGKRAFGRMASVLLFMLFVASMVDYPLRTPSFACFGTLVAVWLAASAGRGGRATARTDRERHGVDAW